jgi:hypothetical protein
VGGLDGFLAWERVCSQWLGLKQFNSEIDKMKLEFQLLEDAILASYGLKIFEDSATGEAFGGGDPWSQHLCTRPQLQQSRSTWRA